MRSRKDLFSELMRTGFPHSGRVGRPVRPGPAAAAFTAPIAVPVGACLILGMLSMNEVHAAKPERAAAPESTYTGPRTLAVLDPVDLTTNLPDPLAGKLLRRSLAANPAWRVLSGDSIAKQLRDLRMDPDLPCSEFQCAFDAGNALQSEFVLFGTSTDLPEVNAYTLGLAHIPSSQMVWSRVGQVPNRVGEGGHTARRGNILEGPLRFAVSDLDPGSLDLRKRPSRGLLGVMDGGQSTPHSRVAMYRALAHAYSSRAFDMLGPSELDALVAALDLDRNKGQTGRNAQETLAAGTGPSAPHGKGGSAAADPGNEDMLALGKQIGVRYLLRSEMSTEGREYAMDLSLYDVAAGKKIRDWPSRGTTDYESLLNLEDRFMTALGEGERSPGADGFAPRPPGNRHLARTFFKGSTISLATLGAGVLGYMAWKSHTQADQAYADFKTASDHNSVNQARSRVIEKDTDTRKFGILAGLSLAFGVAVWTF
jgi:hypothetical protein